MKLVKYRGTFLIVKSFETRCLKCSVYWTVEITVFLEQPKEIPQLINQLNRVIKEPENFLQYGLYGKLERKINLAKNSNGGHVKSSY